MQGQADPLSWKDIERSGWNRNAPGYDARAGQMTIAAVDPLLDAVWVRTMALFRLQTPEVQARIREAILNGAGRFLHDGRVDIPCPALLHWATRH